MKINSLANFSEDLQESIYKRNEENRIKKFNCIEHIEIGKIQWRKPDVKKELKVINNYRIGEVLQGTVVGSWQQCRRWFGSLVLFFIMPLNQSLPHTNQLTIKENYVTKTNTP
jgi:hypothetical protein